LNANLSDDSQNTHEAFKQEDLVEKECTTPPSQSVTNGIYQNIPRKNPGEGWYGNIPDNWEIIKIKYLSGNDSSVVQTGPFGAQLHASDYVDEGVPLILIKNVKDLFIDDSDIPKVSHDDADRLAMYRLEAGDVVFSRVGSIGRIAFVTDREKGWLISGQMLRLRIRNPKLDNHFSIYALTTLEVRRYIELMSVGSTRDSINTDILRNLPIPLPNVSEQRAIATFLDDKTTKIDTLIAKKQRLIELLQVKRTALISQAVTKGLNPDAPMKDSGIEWIGEVPKHWGVNKLKIILERNDNGVWGTDSDNDVGVPVVRSTEINVDGSWNYFEPAIRQLTEEEKRYSLLFSGDLVVTKSSGSELHIGKTALVTEEIERLGCCFSNFMQRLRVKSGNEPAYVYYLMNSPICREQMNFLGSTTTGLANLNGKVLGNIQIPLPTYQEQQNIVTFLNRQTAKIDSLVSKIQFAFEKLLEYRNTLISASVIGQIDVREITS
jgi:type I restriction enzyme, S subunit